MRRPTQPASPETVAAATARVSRLSRPVAGRRMPDEAGGAETAALEAGGWVPPPVEGGWVPPPPGDEPADAPAAAGAAPPRRRVIRVLTGAALERLPVGLQSARLSPGRRGVAVLLVVALVAVLGAGLLVWRSRPTAVTVPSVRPDPARSAPTRPGAAPLAATGGSPAAAPSPGGDVTVDVAGKVHHPGVVTLPAGSRVADAVAAAGGALPGESTAGVNLARRLTDGEQVLVGADPPAAAPTGATAGAGGQSGGASGGSSGGASGGKVNLNSATEQQLDTLPGVGPVLAQRIVAWRQQHGRFASVDQLREVSGVGERKFAEISAAVTV
jgi:competence protein ComEA